MLASPGSLLCRTERYQSNNVLSDQSCIKSSNAIDIIIFCWCNCVSTARKSGQFIVSGGIGRVGNRRRTDSRNGYVLHGGLSRRAVDVSYRAADVAVDDAELPVGRLVGGDSAVKFKRREIQIRAIRISSDDIKFQIEQSTPNLIRAAVPKPETIKVPGVFGLTRYRKTA